MLQRFSEPLIRFRSRAIQLDGPSIERQDKCGFCDSRNAYLLAKADYWNLQAVDLVRCQDCGLIQVDPMLTKQSTETGCLALYRFQHQGETERSRKRGLYRAFRRGVAFGVDLKIKGIAPKSVLEIGAGDGAFLKGLQYVFPKATYTCLDVVDEILQALKKQHGFESIHSTVEDIDPTTIGRFDLIVARDILEHVTKPGVAMKTMTEILSPGGHLFFITPNGWQDAWQMFSRWKVSKIKSELLINHVNYFDTISLRKQIDMLGLEICDWFNYDFKTFSRGAGWRLLEQHMARPSAQRSAINVIQKTESLQTAFQTASESPIPAAYTWLIARPFLMAYCWFKHTAFVRVDPAARVGEEIYCLARKK